MGNEKSCCFFPPKKSKKIASIGLIDNILYFSTGNFYFFIALCVRHRGLRLKSLRKKCQGISSGRVRSGRVGSGCFEIRGWQVRRGIQRTHRVKIQDPSPLAQCETLQTESENTTKIFLNQARVSDNAELLHRHGTASPLYASNRQQHHIAPESRPGGCTNPVA